MTVCLLCFERLSLAVTVPRMSHVGLLKIDPDNRISAKSAWPSVLGVSAIGPERYDGKHDNTYFVSETQG